jgi:hypothetical protein
MALGLGGATISDVMFFKFLKDLKISESESQVLGTLSQVIWFGLAVAIITGIGLFLPGTERLLGSAKFLVKMIVVGVITINGAVLNLLIAPNLVKISFGAPHDHHTGELRHIRRLSFALGAVSIISWYTAFILGLLRRSPADFVTLFGIYLVLLVGGVVTSQIMEARMGRRPML